VRLPVAPVHSENVRVPSIFRSTCYEPRIQEFLESGCSFSGRAMAARIGLAGDNPRAASAAGRSACLA
jgi:hypothetical protein